LPAGWNINVWNERFVRGVISYAYWVFLAYIPRRHMLTFKGFWFWVAKRDQAS